MSTISSIDARFAQTNIKSASNMVTASVANLVSGAKSDANVADLSVGTVLATRVGTLRVAVGNAGQAKSLLETAKGAANTVLSLLQQQKNLSAKAADDSLSDNERGFLDQEFQSLVSEIDRIASTANFNGKALLDGSISGVATVATATGLSAENYGTISAGDAALAGTVTSGDLSTTLSKAGVNKIMIATNDTAGGAGTLVVRDEANANTATISFVFGSTINETINNIVTAANTFSGTNAKTAQNFKFINNGDSSFSIVAKEAGTQFDNFDFQLTDTANALVATMGMDAAGQDVDDNGGAARAFNVDTSITGTDTAISVNGTFGTVASYNVGQTAGIARVSGLTSTAASSTLTITDTNGAVVGAGETVVITWTSTTDEEDAITDLIDIINGGDGLTASDGAITGTAGTAAGDTTAGRLALLRSFVFEKSGDLAMNITGAKKGTALDGVTFQFGAGITVASLNGSNAVGGAIAFNGGTMLQTSADRAVSTTDATSNTNLLGTITNFKATFNQGSGTLAAVNNAQSVVRNSLTFSVDVNGKTYISEPVYLFGGSGLATLGQWGNTIAAGQVITFSDPNGPKDSNGVLTDNAFTLRMGATSKTLADMSTSALAQSSANDIAATWETQLASTSIDQNRSLNLAQINPSNSDHRITSAVGTVLEGLRGFDSVGTSLAYYNAGDITLSTGDYSSTGTIGNIGKFSVDRLTNKITTTVDGEIYTAYLSSNDLPSQGNVVAFGTNLNGTSNIGSYSDTTKILTLRDGSASTAALSVEGTAKLTFFSASTTDGRVLTIDLGHVSENTAQINISTDEGQTALANALNGIFGVSSSESLSFQVGAAASDTIGISLDSAKTADIYKDEAGVTQTLSVATIDDAIAAGTILDRAIKGVVALISSISAKVTSFNSAIQNNQASIQNADAARSNLLDTDYSTESTRFAENRVRVDAASAVLSQINSRIQNLLQLLQR